MTSTGQLPTHAMSKGRLSSSPSYCLSYRPTVRSILRGKTGHETRGIYKEYNSYSVGFRI